MPITPRDNLLRTLRCDHPQWIPVCLHLFPNENPTLGIPSELADIFRHVSGNLARDHLALGERLGAEDYMLPVGEPAALVSDTCSLSDKPLAANRWVTTLATPGGDLRQMTEVPDGAPAMVTERFVKNADDARKLAGYFKSLRVEPSPDAIRAIRDIRARAGDRGILFCRTAGTPLGMCYRVYSDLVNLIYLLADEPEAMAQLFAAMEEKYLLLYERMLNDAPDIDAFFGMDDTSTTLISPAMFEQYNVELTSRRADLCHRCGKIYLHHSCGLIRHLLPVYRKTGMDGVDAFTTPPIGDVSYAEGRALLGPGFSMNAGLSGGLPSLDEAAIRRHVAARFEDARKAGHVVFSVGGAHLTFPAMKMMFEHAQALKRA